MDSFPLLAMRCLTNQFRINQVYSNVKRPSSAGAAGARTATTGHMQGEQASSPVDPSGHVGILSTRLGVSCATFQGARGRLLFFCFRVAGRRKLRGWTRAERCGARGFTARASAVGESHFCRNRRRCLCFCFCFCHEVNMKAVDEERNCTSGAGREQRRGTCC